MRTPLFFVGMPCPHPAGAFRIAPDPPHGQGLRPWTRLAFVLRSAAGQIRRLTDLPSCLAPDGDAQAKSRAWAPPLPPRREFRLYPTDVISAQTSIRRMRKHSGRLRFEIHWGSPRMKSFVGWCAGSVCLLHYKSAYSRRRGKWKGPYKRP